ncbi:MAG: SAM-dependent chlorinase/fluorinase [Ignisphaera sp.]|uniref:SAM-dependent chlorinase/fluorinase n=1 Tax=Ignisphaera aggregans TaxID=334771 RepID=A0A7J3JT75_9CREN
MKKPCGIVAILTDFGCNDYYVAAMKGVILDVCRDVEIVDITHSIENFNLYQAAFTLYASHRYFPEGTVFLAVVDPGVGSSRMAILIVSKRYYFIGPDNGILTPAAKYDGIEKVYMIENDVYFRKPVSKSFHGRDIFAPVAARIACGLEPFRVGRELDVNKLHNINIELFMEKSDDCVVLKVIYIDRFGNVMLSHNFRNVIETLNVDVGDDVYVYAGGDRILKAKILEVFSHGAPNDLILYENSLQLAELAVNLGSAKSLLSVNNDDSIRICKYGY